ncbi:MAG: S8 family serine peptidase [Acidobacteria bacterium]|nr:S8 family serine peptidase [Acidobacteriota bacterium]
MRSAAARSYQQQIESKQKTLRTELASRKIRVTGSASTLMNAVFVIAPKERVSELRGLPGVKDVVPMRRYHQNLNRALPLINGPAAWVALNGVENAGAGMKIAILDSGIDQTHPAFQDPALPMPAGYPICSGGDCTFTNNKVIVARSYVRQLAIGSSVNPPDSRPDDYSARDRDGHGTAVASCAAGDTNTGTVTITGVAPKAYLGNYKIYGSPEVNDSTTTDVIIQAAEDAVNDGMDVISFSSGGPAFTGPLDSGAACGNSAGTPCDLVAAAFENAAKGGVVIVAAAGNDGFNGATTPTFNSIESPGDAPSVISAGATTNAHFFLEVVSVPGSSTLQNIATQSGDALIPLGALTAPLVDVTTRGDSDGLACAALPDGSLNGDIALILRGTCDFSEKLTNAENAGAVGVIFYMADQTPPIPPGGLSNSFTPAVMISNADGLALKNYAASTSTPLVTMDSNGIEETSSGFNLLAGFSSIGPSTGDSAVKPDLVAVGTTMYMAAQRYDSLGALYSSNGYAAADGTSFSTPLVAGAAALVKQSHPGFNTDQIRSALINTATQDVTQDDQGDPVDVQSLGGGKVDVFGAVSATVTAVPATVSFGILTAGSLPKTQQVQVTNNGGNAVTLAVAVAPNITATALPAVDKQSLTLAPGASGAITVTLAGTQPAAGAYSGAITLTGTGVALRIPSFISTW